MMKVLHIDEEKRRVLLECEESDLFEVRRALLMNGLLDKIDAVKADDIIMIRKLSEIAKCKIAVPHHERSPEYIECLEQIASSVDNYFGSIACNDKQQEEVSLKNMRFHLGERCQMRRDPYMVPPNDRSPEIIALMEDMVRRVRCGCPELPGLHELAVKIEKMQDAAKPLWFGTIYKKGDERLER